MTMQTDYLEKGYTLIPGLIPAEVANAFLHQLKTALDLKGVPLHALAQSSNLLKREAAELNANQYAPMAAFLWGLTPTMQHLTGLDLLPTYSYMRIYREGDICRVHSDRYACEHSLSLTLDYSDGVVWELDVDPRHVEPGPQVDDAFGSTDFVSLPMEPGDAVLYQGVHRRHGRTKPNPNAWSAHLFLHWVDRNGPYSAHAFDGQPPPSAVNFKLN